MRTSNKKILLATNVTGLHKDVIMHSVNLSERMEADLEILHFINYQDAEKAEKTIRPLIEEILPNKLVTYIQITESGDFSEEVIRYVSERRDLLCVTLHQTPASLQERKGNRKRQLNRISKAIKRPVLLYTDKDEKKDPSRIKSPR